MGLKITAQECPKEEKNGMTVTAKVVITTARDKKPHTKMSEILNILVIKHRQERFLNKKKIIFKDDQSITLILTPIKSPECNMTKTKEGREDLWENWKKRTTKTILIIIKAKEFLLI